MATPADFIALSLLPIWWWREYGPALRGGEPPSILLERLTDQRQHHEGVPDLRARAAAALDAGVMRGLALVAWNDPDYPAPLAAIIDPPPVIWLRGQRIGLSRPAVA